MKKCKMYSLVGIFFLHLVIGAELTGYQLDCKKLCELGNCQMAGSCQDDSCQLGCQKFRSDTCLTNTKPILRKDIYKHCDLALKSSLIPISLMSLNKTFFFIAGMVCQMRMAVSEPATTRMMTRSSATNQPTNVFQAAPGLRKHGSAKWPKDTSIQWADRAYLSKNPTGSALRLIQTSASDLQLITHSGSLLNLAGFFSWLRHFQS